MDNPTFDGSMMDKPSAVRDEKGRIVSGVLNPKGKPIGATSLKTFAREYLLSLSEEDKMAYLKEMDALSVWRMAEGNPHNTSDETVKHIIPTPILELGKVDSVKLDGESRNTDSPSLESGAVEPLNETTSHN